ncbi:MAG: methyl-accepting chemotaxis protein [Candidatus Methylacidiphilales bacterium]|nr:methyl-accepting chemotaxis protein [Candidatus Methylacidiphilales bacterium]
MAEPTSLSSPSAPPVSTGMSINVKIASAFIGIGAVATLCAALAAYFFYGNELEKSAGLRLDAVRALTRSRVDAELASLQDSARNAGALLRANLRADALDPQIARASLQVAAPLVGPSKIFLCDASGEWVASSDASASLNQARLKQSAAEAARSDSLVYLPTGLSTNDPVLVHITPLIDKQTFPAVVIEIPFSVIGQVLASGPAEVYGESGEAYLVDGTGAVRSPLRGGQKPERIETLGVRSALEGAAGTKTYPNYQGTNVIGSFDLLKTDGFRWAVLAEQSREEALRPARLVTFYVAGVGLVTVILIGVLGVLFAKWMTRPVVALRETMGRIASGDEKARAPILARDEIGQLAESFNRMVDERNAAKERVTTENRRLQSSIQELLLVVADASEGKLSVRARRAEGVLGNVGEALNRMLENVGVLIGQAKSASARVDQAAGAITLSAQELAEGTAEQSARTANAISDVETLTAEARAVAENSTEAAEAAARARKAAEDGARNVREVIEFMERLRENVEANARKITRLGERSQEISGIVRSISDISAETDVLAMNASIEAARAGEQGRGFTIVADQVRGLADRTRQATIEIEKLVAGIQSETTEAVRQMDQQNRDVEQGTRRVGSAGESLGNIVEASVDSSSLAVQISQSARSQEERAMQVLQAVSDVNRITAAARERTLEFRSTSDQLALLAGELNQQLANFEVGSETREPSAPPA